MIWDRVNINGQRTGNYIKKQERLHSANMTREDHDFYKDQVGEGKRNCSVKDLDSKWKATEDRRKLTLSLDSRVTAFLDKFQHITNSIQELEFVRVLAAVEMILESHLIEHFISVISSGKTTWSDLQVAFPKLSTVILQQSRLSCICILPSLDLSLSLKRD